VTDVHLRAGSNHLFRSAQQFGCDSLVHIGFATVWAQSSAL
jgi:hypothetical protein